MSRWDLTAHSLTQSKTSSLSAPVIKTLGKPNKNKNKKTANMKFFTTIMGAALIATGASAQQAEVKNNCASTIYVQSFPYDGSAPGPLTTLKTGESFSEDFRKSGSVSASPQTFTSSDIAEKQAISNLIQLDRQDR
jgi:hypothetical protein